MKKVIAIVLMLVVLCGSFAGCVPASQQEERDYTEQVKKQTLDSIGLPNLTTFFEFSQLKEIYEMRDDPNLIMYWYTKCEMTGKWIYEGKCVGFGIPYGASITNPETYLGSNGAVVDQAEPNGLYTNNVTTSATWVLTVGLNGEIEPNYCEPGIRVTPTKIERIRVEEWSLPSDY